MKLITTGNAGTMESNDIMITVEPSDALTRAAQCHDDIWEVRQDV